MTSGSGPHDDSQVPQAEWPQQSGQVPSQAQQTQQAPQAEQLQQSQQPPQGQQLPQGQQAQQPPQGDQAQQPASQPQPAWARPAAVIQWGQSEPLEYHQLLRGTPRYRWWKPLLGLLLGLIYYLTLSVVFTLAVMVPFAIATEVDLTSAEALNELVMLDTQQPVSILLGLGSVALMLPAALLAMVSIGLTPAGRIWSVALRIRWRWIGRTVLPAIAALVVANVVGIALEIAFSGGRLDDGESVAEALPGFNAEAAIWSMVIVVLLVPLQSTAEEVVFRGAFIQGLGAWFGSVRGSGGAAAFLRGPWLPILIPAIGFGFAHIYDIWGWIFVVVLAIVAGWLTWRTGGLEAAITLHVVNNLIAMSLLASGITGETAQTESGGGLGSVLGAVAGFGLYAWWVDRDFRRKDGRRTRIDYVQLRGDATNQVQAS